MKFQVQTMPEYRIAYMRRVGPYGPGNAELMDQLKIWAEEHQLLTDTSIILGITRDDPAVTAAELCRYDCGLVIPEKLQVDVHVNLDVLSGGKYLICKVPHTAQDIQQAWNEIMAEAIRCGHYVDSRPVFERYTGAMLRQHECELCVPIFR
ncbi:GyrI-like domain-containing protein [Paenibacillus sp. JX-17]|uniref:GyrI-like domain-containing protein n=1 Tax=Paenibacillus lacisoli TaxID=3064525 RepID=A0ABT9CK75_9BACL|nr:GyrI-like domain-containing protein [Paenibacillus sp. JX-17]MDO7908066.1 GyrI-like domain-containing protein [Paenibacillus sp. JX-17]